MLYHAYELTHAAIGPFRAAARMGQEAFSSPFNPLSETYGARASAAACEMFINATRRYGKPEFGIEDIEVDGILTPIVEDVVWSAPFCDLVHFRRDSKAAEKRNDPKVLIVAPMSGHYATLLRGTVQSMLPDHDVYITDWTDARDVPLAEGPFDLDDYTDYLMDMCRFLGTDGARPSVMAVCQPGVPMLVAATLMAADKDPARPASVVLMGSPIDTSRNPKQPNELAVSRPLSWFENNVITTVPWPNRGFMRRVYPGFLQLSGFMSMNLDRHVESHMDQFRHLIEGDGDSAAAHRKFYDEYMAVMDLTAEFYLQTIERVFQKRLLSNGSYMYRTRKVDVGAIRDIALMTVEGEKDDITGLGQTEAAHDLAVNLPDALKTHYVQEKVGHYGVFNGSRWRQHIQPKVAAFIAEHRKDRPS
ncbi:polyhydroxyalkanoate depolymerase [Oceanomicrobium pacificus]|uniref:Polyhydroxyalkanoate depolymerase n=1 Tax=Oceanomicrobium pacificus TaxID=2692916 RepID=A0A6B0TU85_9RHOB|nr:polyhydroxyalkanoate depolymerase [Oceanomicrobium pacificus]MXU64523.1 polyhydroxyalkanoate depolymerase [Oceanomicrobium pacificus]